MSKKMALGLVGLFVAGLAAAESPAGFLSAQGYTGLVNVPTAGVTPHAQLDVHWNDQIDRSVPDNFVVADNYIFSVGVWEGTNLGGWRFGAMELGGRLSNTGTRGFEGSTNTFRGFPFLDGGGRHLRDLSGNAKLQLFAREGWPTLAYGVQDFAGAAVQFRSRYLVSSYDWRWFEITAGMGSGRLDGPFGGVEFTPIKYLSLIAEDDSAQTSFALRLNTADWLKRHRFDVTYRFSADSPSANDDNFVAVNWRHDLGRSWIGEPEPRRGSRPWPATQPAFQTCEAALAAALDRQGFERSRLGAGADGNTLAVLTENKRYNRSILDGFGIALGLAAEYCGEDYEQLLVVISHNGLKKYWVLADSADLLAYFQEGDPGAGGRLAANIASGFGGEPMPVQWQGERRRRNTFLDIVLEPQVNYTVGTEVGVLDYSLALQSYFAIPLWRGAALSFRRNDHIDSTDDVEEPFRPGGRPILANIRIDSEWRAAYLQQAWYFGYGLHNLAHVGITRIGGQDNIAVVDELGWISHSGQHSVLARYARYDYDDPLPGTRGIESRYSFVGKYRYYNPAWNFSADLKVGRFFFEDEGARLDLQRYFGDTSFGIFYRSDRDGENQAGGIAVRLPLTPREDMRGRYVQLRGGPDWSTELQTTVNRDDGTNTLNSSITVEILPDANLEERYLDRGRLGHAAIINGLPRMREAWSTYAYPVARKP